MKISEQNAQRVSNSTIGVSQARENFLGKRNVSRVIDAAGPQANEICAVFIYKMAGVYRLLVSAGFGNFFAVPSTTNPCVTQALYGARLFSAILVIKDDWNQPRC